MTYSQEWYTAFGVMLCAQCKRETPLISKATAKTLYLLSDADLQQLGFLTRSNPQHKNWSAMKMYLTEQVEEVAIKKHGSLEALTELRQHRTHERIQDRASKRKREQQLAEQQEKHLERLTAAAQARAENMRAEAEKAQVAEDVLDLTTGKVTRRYGADMASIEGERI